MKLTKNEIVTLLHENNLNQPKAKYSNNIILQMLENVNDNTIFNVEQTRGKFAINRGSLVEEIVKLALGGKATKTSQKLSDLKASDKTMRARFVENGLNPQLKYEIKFATSFAPASDNAPKTKYTILIVKEGAYLVENKEHQARFTSNSWFDSPRLEKLSETLGL